MADCYELLRRTMSDKTFFHQILPLFTVSTTEMFRDPEFFKMLREQVVPFLKTYPTLKIWVAGCSTGEEVYSLAILLKEEGLYDRSVIFATDINPQALKVAESGIYELSTIQTFSKNYTAAGGPRSPSEYYTADYGCARFDPSLRTQIVFSEHNLVTDNVFAEMHLVLCRNVLIYFRRPLQDHVLTLFAQSLTRRGFLALGSKESVRFSSASPYFDAVDEHCRIYQKNNSSSLPTFSPYVIPLNEVADG